MISIGVGILAAAAVWFSGGTAAYALMAFSAGASITGGLLGPDKKGSGQMRPDEIQVNQSAEDATIPVVFGTTRLPANFIYVGYDEFSSTALYETPEGGKGGGGGQQQQSGFQYTFPLSYGICMGEIDALNRVLGSPGLDVMAEFDPPLTFPTGPEVFDISYTKQSGENEYMEGGTATFYPGTATQGDATTTDKNHRGVCWVDFPIYTIDGTPSPRTMLFEVSRMPRVTDDAGAAIANFPVRASTNPADPEYLDANPAAVAWEVLQNPTWGKGMLVANLHPESFAKAARYYAANRLGISTGVANQTLTQFMARLREIFGLLIWWDGERMRCRCEHDRGAAYTYQPRLKADDVIGTPEFARASLSGTANEIRLEFTNRENNWQQEVVSAMDLAHAETIGGIRSQTVDGSEIGTRRAAELIAHEMLRRIAYPPATCTLRLRRTYSGLQPGAFVELIWDEWRDNGAATTYWRVAEIEDDDQGTEGITVTLTEDIYATAQDGEVSIFDVGFSTIDGDTPLVNGDLVEGDITGQRDPGSILPVIAWEPPIHLTGGTRRIMIAPTRRVGWVESVSVAWSNAGEATTRSLGLSPAMPINGILDDPIAAATDTFLRGQAIKLTVYRPSDAARFEAATGLVIDDADDFDALTRSYVALAMIEGELFRVGHAEATGPDEVTLRVFARAQLGTAAAEHLAGAPVVFFPTFNPALMTPCRDIPLASPINLHLTPNTTQQATVAATVVPGGAGFTPTGNSIRPTRPELYSATRVGATWTVYLRPVLWWTGAGYRPNIDDDAATLVGDLTGLSFRFQKATGGGLVTVPAGTSYATAPFTMPADIAVTDLQWIPDSGSPGTGLVKATITFDSSPATLHVWAVRDAIESTAPLAITQP